jgi:hypothetical protein
MDTQKYKSLLSMYWSEIVTASNWSPVRWAELSCLMTAVVKTGRDEQEAMRMQTQLYQLKLNRGA